MKKLLLFLALVTTCFSQTPAENIQHNLGTGTIKGTTTGTVQVVENVRFYGAKGDGITDDTAALNSAVNAAEIFGAPVYLPQGTYATTTGITWDAGTYGSATIYGDGALSVIKMTGTTNGGILITGTAGVTTAPQTILNLAITSANSGTSAYGLHLNGIAIFLVSGLWIEGSSTMAKGIWLTASQQGQISGGKINHCTVGGYVEDNAGGGIRSNGVDWHGMSINCSGGLIGFQIANNSGSAGADDISFHSNHVIGAATQFDIDGSGGAGLLNFSENHVEPTGSNKSFIIRGGNVDIVDNIIGGTNTDVDILNGVNACKIDGNLIVGNVTFESGATNTIFAFNVTGGIVTDNGTKTRNFCNVAESGTQITGSALFDALSITANSTGTAGDILTLNPNGNVGGNWGETITGAGSGDIYLRFGSSGPTIGGFTGDGNIHVRASLGGIQWGFFSPNGWNGPGGTTPVLGTSAAVTTGAGSGAGTLTNAPVAGNPTKWIPFNDNGTIRYFPAW
jgi:hypothetical protein